MSELSERRWAVISERGVEASGVAYNEASQLVRRLKAEKVSGLCIITSEAAHRLSSEQKSSGETLPAEAVPQK
ncbi:MAG TPA: hypothetical protein VM943_12975 [Pyrinomonadaceae bacterium]|nr:hypothetical protein [Pyrinomonadaceae bacterium]